jgi:hypothetical protein
MLKGKERKTSEEGSQQTCEEHNKSLQHCYISLADTMKKNEAQDLYVQPTLVHASISKV